MSPWSGALVVGGSLLGWTWCWAGAVGVDRSSSGHRKLHYHNLAMLRASEERRRADAHRWCSGRMDVAEVIGCPSFTDSSLPAISSFHPLLARASSTSSDKPQRAHYPPRYHPHCHRRVDSESFLPSSSFSRSNIPRSATTLLPQQQEPQQHFEQPQQASIKDLEALLLCCGVADHRGKSLRKPDPDARSRLPPSSSRLLLSI